MKQKTKIIFLLLLVTGTLFFSCNLEEEYASEKIHQDNMSVYHKNFNELLKNNKFIKAYNKVLTKKSQTAKTAMEEQYQFTIANNLANVVEGNNEISYTLLIQREVNDPKSFENLVIISDSLNNTSAYIIKYSSNNQINTSNFNPSNSEFSKQITPIIYNPTIINESSKEAYYYCYDIMFWVCTYTGHTTTGVCTHGHYETVTVCEEVIGTGTGGDATGDSGSSSIDGSSSDGGGGGSATPDSNYNGTDTSIHGNGGTPITTAPIIEEEIVEDPCEQLKAVTNDIPTKNKIFDLKPRTLGKQEFAIDIERKWDYEREIYVYNPIPTPPGSNFMTNVQVGGRTMGQAHNHPINGQSIPSWGDIRWTMLCEQNIWQINIGHSVNIIVVQNSQYPSNTPIIYAIKINDLAVLQQQIAQDLALPDIAAEPELIAKIEKINAKFGLLNANVQNNTQGLERNFLGQFRNYGISLYKFDETNNNWNKLNLQNAYNPQNPDTQNPVISEPCN